MTDVYLQLDYRAYKHLEDQLENFRSIETTHTTMEDPRYYHKALRLEIGDLTLEVQGPAVRAAIEEPIFLTKQQCLSIECHFFHVEHYVEDHASLWTDVHKAHVPGAVYTTGCPYCGPL